MNYLKQVQIGIDYIEAHLDTEISLAQVAEAAGISQWHFQRIFKALTNETLKTYIRSRRFASALEKLLVTKTRIIDIALGAGFESQESFTRAFKKTFAMTPNQYRKLGNKSLFLKKIQFNSDYLRHINQNISLQPQIYHQEKKLLVGLRTCFYGVDSEKNNIAEKLPPLWDNFLRRKGEIQNLVLGMGYGVVQQTQEKTDQLEYYAAFEVSQLGTVPEKMLSIELPAATYAKFTHRGEVKNINNTVNYIYSNWLLQSGLRHTYGADLEFYGAEYHPLSDKSVIHYAIPVEM
ncbi:MAG: effector binding domain-containing protein [Gammaproteobacteria bacterium]|nr:effector binding domain-containing protein [Gammaproteobacteria bacterium]